MRKKVIVFSLAWDMLHLYQNYQNMSESIKVMESTRFWLQVRLLHNEESKAVLHARDMTTGPPLYFYKTLSKYVLGYQSYGVHKILASGEITT